MLLLAVVDVELLTMVADKPSAAELLHNIDNRLSEPMFDADKPSAVRYDCNTRFIKGHKPSNHIRARIKSHVYTNRMNNI